jgi:outer membrane protein
MINKILIGIAGLLIIYAATLTTITFLKTPKIGYIESSVMMEKYQGAQKAREEMNTKSEEWKKNIQTLETELNQLNQEMVKDAGRWSRATLAQKQEKMQQKQQEYGRYSRAINEKAQQLEKELFTPVYNELNAKLTDFGKAKGYDIIFGTISGGNILYGDTAADVTEKFLEYIRPQVKK